MRTFASDNASGLLPEALEALARVNDGHALAYGADPVTARAKETIRGVLGRKAVPFLLWGGTAANVIGLRAICEPYHAVLCAEGAHLDVDECAAPERFLGGKLVTVPAEHGKVTAEAVERRIRGRGDVHHVQPRVLSVTQPTEVGTLYSIEELKALGALCRKHQLLFHMDGARLYQAAAALEVELREISTDVGVDVLSLGGTKCGLLAAEAIIFLRPELVGAVAFHRKQGMQLASKMRFVAAQLDTLLTDRLWLRPARHANRMAQLLSQSVKRLPSIEVVHPVQTNAVFARVPRRILDPLQARWGFYVWAEHETHPVVRWMTAFDTTAMDVDGLVEDLRLALD